MRELVDHQNPVDRGYREKATVKARVLIDRIHYDEGYREAEKGETVDVSPEDFDVLEVAGHVEPEEDAAKRDEREAKRAAAAAQDGK